MAGKTSQIIEMKLAQARKEFVQSRSSPTLEDVARMYDLGVSTVKERSSSGGWVEERQEFQEQLSLAIQNRDLPDLAEQTGRIRTKMYDLLETAIDRTREGLKSGQLAWTSPKQAVDTVGHLMTIMREAGLTGNVPVVSAAPGAEKTVNTNSVVAMFINGAGGQLTPGQTTIDVTPGRDG